MPQQLPIYIPPYIEDDFRYMDLSEPTEIRLLYIITNLIADGEMIVEDVDIAYVNTHYKDRLSNEEIYLLCVINRNPDKQKWFAKKLCLKSELENLTNYYRHAQLGFKTQDELINSTYEEIYQTEQAKMHGYASTVVEPGNKVYDPAIIKKVRDYDAGTPMSLHRDGVTYNKMVTEKVVQMNGFPKPTKEELMNISVDSYKDGGIDFIFFEYRGFMINNLSQISSKVKSMKNVTVHIGQSKFYSVFDINNIKDFLSAIDNFTELEPINPYNDKMARRHELFKFILEHLSDDGTLIIKPYFASYGSNDDRINQEIYGNTVLMERNLKRKDSLGRIQLQPITLIGKDEFIEDSSDEEQLA